MSATLCPATMILPPQRHRKQLQCQLLPGHTGLHVAQDPDRIMRRWPTDGSPAAETAMGATHERVRST